MSEADDRRRSATARARNRSSRTAPAGRRQWTTGATLPPWDIAPARPSATDGPAMIGDVIGHRFGSRIYANCTTRSIISARELQASDADASKLRGPEPRGCALGRNCVETRMANRDCPDAGRPFPQLVPWRISAVMGHRIFGSSRCTAPSPAISKSPSNRISSRALVGR